MKPSQAFSKPFTSTLVPKSLEFWMEWNAPHQVLLSVFRQNLKNDSVRLETHNFTVDQKRRNLRNYQLNFEMESVYELKVKEV